MSAPVQTKVGSQNLATGALTLSVLVGTDTVSTDDNIELCEVLLTAGAAISQVVTVSHVGKEGANYTFVLKTSTLSSETSFNFRPETGKCVFKRGDTIKLTCANSLTPAITVYAKIQCVSLV